MKLRETLEEMQQTSRERIAEAYIRMACEANYRPEAPGDGCGAVELSDEQLQSAGVLNAESERYAKDFSESEDRLEFRIGCSNYESVRALVFTIEAARLMCAAEDRRAIHLLGMAISELARSVREL